MDIVNTTVTLSPKLCYSWRTQQLKPREDHRYVPVYGLICLVWSTSLFEIVDEKKYLEFLLKES